MARGVVVMHQHDKHDGELSSPTEAPLFVPVLHNFYPVRQAGRQHSVHREKRYRTVYTHRVLCLHTAQCLIVWSFFFLLGVRVKLFCLFGLTVTQGGLNFRLPEGRELTPNQSTKKANFDAMFPEAVEGLNGRYKFVRFV